jgi:hypothetical protein
MSRDPGLHDPTNDGNQYSLNGNTPTALGDSRRRWTPPTGGGGLPVFIARLFAGDVTPEELRAAKALLGESRGRRVAFAAGGPFAGALVLPVPLPPVGGMAAAAEPRASVLDWTVKAVIWMHRQIQQHRMRLAPLEQKGLFDHYKPNRDMKRLHPRPQKQETEPPDTMLDDFEGTLVFP